MKTLIILASLLIGAIAVNAQTTPLTFKTSAGLTVDSTTNTVIYADVTNLGSSSVTGVMYFVSTPSVKNSNAVVIPVVSNDGTYWSPVKTNWSYTVGSGVIAPQVPTSDTVYRGIGTFAVTDTASGYNYRFPTGYKYIGFKLATQSGRSAIAAKGLAK